LLLCTAGALTGAEKNCCPAPAAGPPAACCSAKETPQYAACCPAEPEKPQPCCSPSATAAKPCACPGGAGKPIPAAETAPCCPTDGEAGHAGLPAGDFSRDSLYQLEVTFTDDTGRTFALGELRGRPVALSMFFASCGYACPLTVTDLLAIQAQLSTELRAKTAIVLVSFDTVRDTTGALAEYRAQRQLDGQWILLRGSADAVRELAALLGVKYKQEADGQFAHSNLVTILNAEGEIIHQRLGLKGGLVEAAAALAAEQSK
jgi:protein SCO1/2